MAYQLQTLPGQFQPPNPYEELSRGFKDYQGFQKHQSDMLKKHLENEIKKKELASFDRMLDLDITKALADIGLSQAQTQESQARTREIPLTADYERWLLSEQAKEAGAKAEYERFKAENPELFFKGAPGELAQRKFVRSKYGTPVSPGISGGIGAVPGQEVAGMGAGIVESQQPISEEESIFNEVFSSASPAYQSIVGQDVIPLDPMQREMWQEFKAEKEASMTPGQRLQFQEFTKQEAKLRPELNTKLNTSMSSASNINSNLEKAQNAFSKLGSKEKGFLYGQGPELTGPANEVSTAIAEIVNSAIQGLRGMGQVSNLDLQWVIDRLPQRKMTDEGFAQTVKDLSAIQNLVQKNVIFMNYAMDVKGLNSSQAQNLWNSHVYKNPLKLGTPAENEDEEAALNAELKSRGVE